MATPKKINIEFTATGTAIDVIGKLSKVQNVLTKTTEKVVKSQKQLQKCLNRQLEI